MTFGNLSIELSEKRTGTFWMIFDKLSKVFLLFSLRPPVAEIKEGESYPELLHSPPSCGGKSIAPAVHGFIASTTLCA